MEEDSIKQKFKRVISYSQLIYEKDINVDDLFERWKKSKQKFIDKFNGKLIYDFGKISFEFDDSEKSRRVDELIERIQYHYNNNALASFLMLMADGFFLNTVMDNYELPDGTIIPKGAKLIKSFKYFENDKNCLTAMQDEASMLIQSNQISGNLCISVHPLDFLSLSENACHWRSCHALDGEYRAGNLSYMVDTSTVICYLRSDKDCCLAGFPPDVYWNSKKWRVLMFLSEDEKMLFAGRQYPFLSTTGINIIKNRLFPEIGYGYWGSWHKSKLNMMHDDLSNQDFYFENKVPVGKELVTLRNLVGNQPNSLNFNDLTDSSVYDCLYSYKDEGHIFLRSNLYTKCTNVNTTIFKIGGSVKCLHCGQRYIESTETMLCNHCELEIGNLDNEDFGYCDCCGRHINLNDVNYIGNSPICDDCVLTEATRCEICGELYYNEDVVYDRQRNKNVCKYCDGGLF